MKDYIDRLSPALTGYRILKCKSVPASEMTEALDKQNKVSILAMGSAAEVTVEEGTMLIYEPGRLIFAPDEVCTKMIEAMDRMNNDKSIS